MLKDIVNKYIYAVIYARKRRFWWRMKKLFMGKVCMIMCDEGSCVGLTNFWFHNQTVTLKELLS